MSVRHSNFSITINSQQEANKQGLKSTLNILNKLDNAAVKFRKNINQFITFRAKEETGQYHLIKKLDFGYVSAIGGKQTKIHQHSLLMIEHTSKGGIHLDLTKLRQFFANELEMTNVHAPVKILYREQDVQNWIGYMDNQSTDTIPWLEKEIAESSTKDKKLIQEAKERIAMNTN